METTTTSRPHLPSVAIGRCHYLVRSIPVSAVAQADGCLAYYVFEGPRGAVSLIVDYGPRYALNVIGSELRGLDRSHVETAAERLRAWEQQSAVDA